MLKDFKQKKAQITLFVIIAVVILIIGTLIFFLARGGDAEQKIDDKYKMKSVPTEFKPIRDYVDSCVHSVGLRGLKLLGSHGGMIDPSDLRYSSGNLKFISSDAADSDLVSLSGELSDAIPYYLYVDGRLSRDNYEGVSLVPSIEYMESQLSLFVEYELKDCLGDYSALEQQGYDVVPADLEVDAKTVINDKIVDIYVNYNLDVVSEDSKTSISTFKSTLNVPFKEYYNIALDITTTQAYTQFMEMFSKSLISYHSSVALDRLPPIIGFSRKPYTVTWMKPKVAHDFDGLLSSYVSAIQVKGSKGYTAFEEGTSVEDKFYDSLSLDIYSEEGFDTIKDRSINFFYVPNSLALDVNPSIGNKIVPSVGVDDKGLPMVSTENINTYRFFYNLEYPVVVEVRGDDKASEIPDFSFLFALETNLLDNKPWMAWSLGMGSVEWDPSNVEVTFDFDEDALIGVSDTTSAKEAIVKSISSKKMFCNPEQFLSGDLSIRAVDDKNQPLDDVTVTYACGGYASCWLGSTVSDGTAGLWSGSTPICRGGLITLSKDGYSSRTVRATTNVDKKLSLPTETLVKKVPISFSVKKRQIIQSIERNNNWKWDFGNSVLGTSENLDASSEQVIVSIEQVATEDTIKDISHSVVFGQGGISEISLDLVPGRYTISAQLIDNKGFVISKECARYCSAVACCDHNLNTVCALLPDYTYYPDKNTVLKSMVWGGVEINRETTGYFEVSYDDLQKFKEVELTVLKLPDLTKAKPSGGCIQTMDLMNDLENYYKSFASMIMPVLK